MKFLIAVALAGASVIAVAASPTNQVWTGRYSYDFSKLPNTLTPAQKAQVMEMSKKREQSVITLTLKPDHTFSMIAKQPGAGPKPVTGTWSRDKDSINLITSVNGKRGPEARFVFDKTGKKMSFSNGPATLAFSQ